MHTVKRTVAGVCSAALIAFAAPATAPAADIAVFGNNAMDDFLTGQGHTTTLVTNAQLATPGFLSGFDAFVLTRNGFSFGTGLSPAAAAEVAAYAGRIVALNGDFADSLPGGWTPAGDPEVAQLVANSADWAAAGSAGVIGEFNGAVSLFGSNSNGFSPLGLLTGSAGPLGGSFTDYAAIDATPVGTGHPVLSGVALPDDPQDSEFGAQISGADPAQVLAVYTRNGNPAILAREVNQSPDCSGLTADPATLWPPNHKLRTVTVSGGTDPDGDALTHSVVGVSQDEPVTTSGTGSTAPDAQLGPNADQAQLRAERSAGGDGRVYLLAVNVTDPHGGACTGTATVAVPHDKGGAAAVDSGPPHHDSLVP